MTITVRKSQKTGVVPLNKNESIDDDRVSSVAQADNHSGPSGRYDFMKQLAHITKSLNLVKLHNFFL